LCNEGKSRQKEV